MINNDLLSQLTLEEIDQELLWRQELCRNMIGWLYPSILLAEVQQLNTRRRQLHATRNAQS